MISLASRAPHGGAALARPFDGGDLDILTGPGPHVQVTQLANGYTGFALSMGTGAPNNAGNLGETVTGTSIGYDNADPCGLELFEGAELTDSFSQLPVSGQDQGPVVVLRCNVPTAVNAQVAFNNSQPAISIAGLAKFCTVNNTAEDGIWPKSQAAGLWTVFDFLYAMGGSVPFYSGWTVSPSVIPWTPGDQVGANTGNPLTKAQILSAVNYFNANGSGQNGGTNGVTVPVGGFIMGPSTGWICPIYQCIGSVDGTTSNPLIGNESTTTWPNGSANKWSAQTSGSTLPFQSGNAWLAPIGGAYHCDSIQCVGNPSRVKISNFKLGQFGDVALLMQNDNSVKSLPPMNWTLEHGQIYGAGSYDIPVSSDNPGSAWYTPPTGSNMHNPTGPYKRNSDGTWEVDPNVGQSLPWFLTFRDIQHNNSISVFAAARNPATDVYFDKAYDPAGAPILPTVQARDLLIASQHGWDATDQRVGMMREGTYPWQTEGIPAPVSEVLEARYQDLLTSVPPTTSKAQVLSPAPGLVAAQMMPVIEKTVRNQQGVSLTPATSTSIGYPVNTLVTNSDGYCTMS